MIDAAGAQALVKQVLKLSRATETEVILGGGRAAVARFEANHLTAHSEVEWPQLSVRVGLRRGKGWLTGWASTRSLEPAELKAVVERAVEIARLSAPDPEYLPMLHPDEAGTWTGDVSRSWRAETAQLGPARRVALVSELVLPCRRVGASASGALTITEGAVGSDGDPGITCVGNSRGLLRFHASAAAELSCRVLHAGGGEAWGESWGRSASSLGPAALIERLLRRAALGSDAAPLASGPMAAVLEPAAVASLLGALLPCFDRGSFDAGGSAVGELLGQRALAPGLSLFDDPFHPLHQARPFDGEGLATQVVELVRTGIVRGFLYTRAAAARHKLPPTGHTPQQPSRAPTWARAPVLTGGVGDAEALASSIARGVLIPQLVGLRVLEPRSARVSATAVGLLRVEGGRLVGGAPPMELEVSVLELLRDVVAGAPVRAGGMVVPPLRVEGLPLRARWAAASAKEAG